MLQGTFSKLGLDEATMSWNLKFGFLVKNYPYSLIPRSKLANPGQNVMTSMLSCVFE